MAAIYGLYSLQRIIIFINENHSIFHWRKILENADNIVLVDSAMANFVEHKAKITRKFRFVTCTMINHTK